MDRGTLDRIVELGSPHFTELYGETYSDVKMYKVVSENIAAPIQTHTLTSVVEYLKSFVDKDDICPQDYMIHIIDPETVVVVSCLNSDRKREEIIKATAIGPRFSFGSFIENEKFTIQLQSMFADDEKTDKDLVLKFSGTVTAGTVKEYGDDGITQKATIKTGITTKDVAVVPSPCTLRPYRTFTEVEQPESKFIFRMRDSRDTVESALFVADGDSWKIKAMQNIRDFFNTALEDMGITVLM